MNLCDFLKSINSTKKNLMDQDPECEKFYIPYVVNKSFSYFSECLFHANFMNKFHELPKKMQYDYFFYTLKKKNRFSKWVKEEHDSQDITDIMEYYGYSRSKAKEVLGLFTQEEMKYIREQLGRF